MSGYDFDSIARGLDHHQAAGVVLDWSWHTARDRFVVRLAMLGVVDLTKAQAWAFCVALAAAERYHQQQALATLDDIAAASNYRVVLDDSPSLREEGPEDWAARMHEDERSGAAVCPTCRLSAHHPGCPTPWAAMVTP